MRSLSSRLKVVGTAVAVGVSLSGLSAMLMTSKLNLSLVSAARFWGSMIAGPFAGQWWMAPEQWSPMDTAKWAVVLCAAILAHPIRAGRLTGTISAIGIAMWFFIGFSLVTDGV